MLAKLDKSRLPAARAVQGAVAAKLSAAVGKTIRYVNVPPEAARQAQLAAGMPPYLADALFELFAERRNGKEAKVWPDAATLLGRRPTSFDQFASFEDRGTAFRNLVHKLPGITASGRS